MSKCIVIVGATGSGKSHTVKGLLKAAGKPAFIFDVQNEYGTNKPLPEVNVFLDNALKLRGHIIVFEEASAFFKHGMNEKKLDRLLLNKRHHKNTIVFCFHSLRRVPIDILDMIDLLIIGHTRENPTLILTKYKDFPEVTKAFIEVGKDENPFVKKWVKFGNW